MSNTTLRPNIIRSNQYFSEVVPQLRQHFAEITGDTERDDSSIGGSDNKGRMSAADFETLGYRVHGALLLKASTSPMEFAREDGSGILDQDEPYMSIHLRPLEPQEATRAYINESLTSVADYLRSPENRAGEVLAGITYARLGQTAAQAFGFEASPLPLIPDVTEHPDIQPVMVHQQLNTFLEMYQ